MRTLLFILLLVPFAVRAANPAFTDFNTNQFGTNGNKVFVKSGASITNAVLTTPELGVAAGTSLDLSPNGNLNIIRTNLITSLLSGLSLSNATLATVGTQVQNSPILTWQANAWLVSSASNANTIFRTYTIPVAGVSVPIVTWFLESSLNGAAWANALQYNSSGTLTAAGSILSGGLVQAAVGQTIGFNTRSKISSSADGMFEFNNSGTTARSTAQFNIPQTTKTANYTNVAALDSGMRFVNIGAGGAITNTLPTAVAGQRYFFYVDAAQIYSVKAVGTDVIRDAATVGGAAKDIWSNAVGSTLSMFCPKAGLWVVEGKQGTWTNNP